MGTRAPRKEIERRALALLRGLPTTIPGREKSREERRRSIGRG